MLVWYRLSLAAVLRCTSSAAIWLVGSSTPKQSRVERTKRCSRSWGCSTPWLSMDAHSTRSITPAVAAAVSLPSSSSSTSSSSLGGGWFSLRLSASSGASAARGAAARSRSSRRRVSPANGIGIAALSAARFGGVGPIRAARSLKCVSCCVVLTRRGRVGDGRYSCWCC
eukprot:1575852-Prymnesium_polylepis.1